MLTPPRRRRCCPALLRGVLRCQQEVRVGQGLAQLLLCPWRPHACTLHVEVQRTRVSAEGATLARCIRVCPRAMLPCALPAGCCLLMCPVHLPACLWGSTADDDESLPACLFAAETICCCILSGRRKRCLSCLRGWCAVRRLLGSRQRPPIDRLHAVGKSESVSEGLGSIR